MRLSHRMRHASIFLIGFVLLGSLCWLINPRPAYASGGSIRGTVTDNEGNPLANVGIQLYLDIHDQGLWQPKGVYAVTDQAGQYTLADVETGTYRLSFNDGNWPLMYASEYYNNAFRLKDAQNVTVTADKDTIVDAQLADASRIAGIITDTDGKPIDGIQVTLQLHNSNNPTEWSSALRHTTTDNNGAYTFEGVDIGSYQLMFTDSRSPHSYSTEYYQNAALGQATDIVVTNQETLVFNAELAQTGSVTGLITDEEGHPLSGITVAIANDIESDGWRNALYFQADVTDGTGVYTLTGVDVGLNRLCFSDYTYHYADECYDNTPNILRATDIPISADNTVTANAQLALRGGISGTVTDATGQPLPSYQVYLYSDPYDDGNWINGGNWRYTNATGVYSFTGLNPDVYRVSFQDPSGQVNAPEFYNDSLSLAGATDIVVKPGKITPNINAQLEPFSHITGTVTDSQGQPLENIFVSVYGMAPDVDSLPFHQPLFSIYTKADGSYNLTGLLPGEYYVGFADPYNNALHTEYYDDAGYLMTADCIRVGRVMTVTNINVQLSPFEAVNYPPFATNDTAYVRKGGTTHTITMPWGPEFTVLINDRDAEYGPLTATLTITPTHGTVTLDASGLFTYTHDGSEATQDFFTYRAYDGILYSPPATVTVLITPVVALPVAVSDAIQVVHGRTVRKLLSGATSLLTNDINPKGQPLTATLVTTPTHGQVSLAANGTFTYTHDGSDTTQDWFTYRAGTVGGVVSAPATVTVTIRSSSIEFTKTVWIAGLPAPCGITNSLRVPVSTTVAYCYTVHNNGISTLTHHTLTDDNLGTLLAGQTYTLTPDATYQVIVTQTMAVTTTNVATWTAATSRLAAVEPLTATAVATVTLSTATDDQDHDGIHDVIELVGDLDYDNLPNFLDPDADGDTIPDQVEVGNNPLAPKDSNNDGLPDYLDPFIPLGKRLYLPLIAR